MPQTKSRLWTLPNVLTIFRMLLIPIYWVLMMRFELNYWALGTFVLAAATDVLDGFLARRMHQITDFGKLMDPLADKLMVISVLITLMLRGLVPLPAVVLLMAKELFMLIGGLCLYRRKIVVHAQFIGKCAQCAVCLALILSFFESSFAAWPFQPNTILLWIGVGMAYSALLFYIRSVYRQLKGIETTYRRKSDADTQ